MTIKDKLIHLAVVQIEADVQQDNDVTSIEGMFVHLLFNKDKGEQVIFDYLSDSGRDIIKEEFKDWRDFVTDNQDFSVVK